MIKKRTADQPVPQKILKINDSVNEIPTNTTMPADYGFIGKTEGCIKIMSWNVASLPAAMKKGFTPYVSAEDADIICLQETKINKKPDNCGVDFKVWKWRYFAFCNDPTKKGYGSAKC